MHRWLGEKVNQCFIWRVVDSPLVMPLLTPLLVGKEGLKGSDAGESSFCTKIVNSEIPC